MQQNSGFSMTEAAKLLASAEGQKLLALLRSQTPLGVGGYLDIGLIDTMSDLLVNFIGAVVFSFIGFFYVKSQGKGKLASQFIPQLMEKQNPERQEES